jgi:cytochrome c peroxidase
MFISSLRHCKCTTWSLVPLIAGLVLGGLAPATLAHAATYPITSPDDARTWGLDSLGNMMSGKMASYPNPHGKPLVLNPNFKVPLPPNLGDFVKNRKAALVLGKALFWDMQVGSDGIQACASCHFQAGGDVRTMNQVATQGNRVLENRDGEIKGYFFAGKTAADTFETVGSINWFAPNYPLLSEDFPLVNTQNAYDRVGDTINADTESGNRNDVVGSMGVIPAQFVGVTPGWPVDKYAAGTAMAYRPTTGRNAPPSVQAVFNYLQFWDGRADSKFNGVNPIGRHDTSNPVYYVNISSNSRFKKDRLEARTLNMELASLASQSTGPPLSDVEMSFAGRKWPDIGKKLTRFGFTTPLAYQKVSRSDSVLGPYVSLSGRGLRVSYKELVKAAFKDELWNNNQNAVWFPFSRLVRTHKDEKIMIQGPPDVTTLSTDKSGNPVPPPDLGGYTQMEANFSLFWGIAVMLYEAELVSEQSKFDMWMEGKAQLTDEELDGLNVFVKEGKCIACHGGPEFTNASVRITQAGRENVEPILRRDGTPSFYTNGFYNVGMTPTVDDIQHGAPDPNGKPWGSARQFLFKYNNIMSIPFSIDGLPIRNLESRQVDDAGVLKTGLFKVDEAAGTDFLVCYDLNADGMCGLEDDIVIKALDQDGNCKASHLRNVELNGPYFHNGGAATLQQALTNYDVGGKFSRHPLNRPDMLPDITPLNLAEVSTPNGFPAERALVAFMLTLTDHRVKKEAKPFDHPQLFVPSDGTAPMLEVSAQYFFPAAWNAWLVSQVAAGKFEEDPATGASGGAALEPFISALGGGYTNFDEETGKDPFQENQ